MSAKRKTNKKASKVTTGTMMYVLKRCSVAADDIKSSIGRLDANDIGGCLQCLTFALQELESAKSKLRKV